MRYLSVCSGIEAATVAWHPFGWKAFAYSEIEKFPSAVLAHHYPSTPNLGDMTKFKEWPDAAIDVLVGGTPCQSFSVAGLRKGLADPRGNLMLTYGAIAAKYRPAWLVWENVPGVLSSNGGRDFGTFLGMLAELGYGFAYRVLDAQYFGVAQRRRRVFVVGHLGDWRRAAAVLFERHSMQGHPAPRREAGKRVAPCLDVRAGRSGETTFHTSGGLTYASEIARCVTTGEAKRQDYETCTLVSVAGAICKESFSGGAGGRPEGADAGNFVPVAIRTANTSANGHGISEGVAHTLDQAQGQAIAFQEPIAFPWQQGGTLGMSGTLVKNQTMAVAVSLRGREGGATAELGDEVGNCLRASGGGGDKAHVLAPVAFNSDQSEKTRSMGEREEQTPTLRAGGEVSVAVAMQVRRLTPVECERLQGFPDNYTQVPHRNKPAADGPRYKALGNSMAVPVMRWIGERIQMVEVIDAGKETKCA